jgi:hypothetical protein
VFTAPRGRLLREVVEFRRREWLASVGKGWGSKGWVGTIKASLDLHGLGEFWVNPSSAAAMPSGNWKTVVYDAVNARSNTDREATLASKPSALNYIGIKEWGPNPREYSFSEGEVGKPGQLVPERYLDDRTNLKGTRLKMLCRLGCLPLMDRVGRETSPPWPLEYRTCAACNSDKIEDIHHFLMQCPRYEGKRSALLRQTVRELARTDSRVTAVKFATMSTRDQLDVLLGKRISDPTTEDRIDRSVKRYLSKCWNLRGEMTVAVNEALFTSYGIYSAIAAA